MNRHVLLATLTACLPATSAAVRAEQRGERVNRYLDLLRDAMMKLVSRYRGRSEQEWAPLF